ncbi:MAG: NAD-dependent epimerase/dehydratase family protein, partial [Myxococcota bacterium]
MKQAFLTGATGFLGQNLVEQLRAAGWSITAVHRASSKVEPLKRFDVDCVVGDLLDAESLAAGMPEGVDAVFHVAGNTSIWRRHAAIQTRDNVEGTAAVLDAARRRGAKRFVYTSSWVTFGLEHAEIDESTPQTGQLARDNYSRSKHAAEQRVLDSGLDAVVLNPAHILGRYDRGNWSRFVTMVDQGT